VELTNEFRVSVPVEDAWAVLTDVERIAPCMPGAQLLEVEGDKYRGVVKVKVGPITAQYKGTATFQSKDDDAHVAVLKAEGRDTRGQGNANALVTATLNPDGDGTAVKVVTDLTITGKVAQFGRGVLVDVSAKLLTQFVECLEDDLRSGEASPAAPAAAAAKPAEGAGGDAGGSAAPTSPGGGDAPGSAGDTASAGGPTAGTAVATEAKPATGSSVNGQSAPAQPPAGAPAVRKIDHRVAEPVDLLDAAGVPVAKRAIPLVAGVVVILWFLRRRRRNR